MKKWRNKITGEINEFMVHKRIEDSEDGNPVYAPFDGHIDDWEDYEEPKEYWYIGQDGVIFSDIDTITQDYADRLQEIGNYFETREEAEEAVEKLKAWKRLKDNGMTKYSFHKEKRGIDLDFYTLTILAPRDEDSLDLLFGGEE